MRIRRRGTDAPPHGQAAPSTQTRSPPAPSPTSARHSGTTARSAETPSREANPSMWEETPFRHAQPSRGCRKSQEEEEKGESDKAAEDEKAWKEDGRSEQEHGGCCPVHVDCSTGEVPKGEDEERRREVDDEKASEDPTRANVSVAICRKGDGKGWHCKRPAQMGYSLCQYHLDKLRSYGSRSRKRKPQAAASPPEKPGIQRQGATQLRRTKRRRMEEHVPSGTGTGLSDSFYYYSGFGPRWGKRRADRSGDVVKLPGDGGASDHVHPLDDTGDAAPAAVKEEEEEEDEYEWPSRDGKPWKSRPLSSLL